MTHSLSVSNLVDSFVEPALVGFQWERIDLHFKGCTVHPCEKYRNSRSRGHIHGAENRIAAFLQSFGRSRLNVDGPWYSRSHHFQFNVFFHCFSSRLNFIAAREPIKKSLIIQRKAAFPLGMFFDGNREEAVRQCLK